jgi:hypothetical protein
MVVASAIGSGGSGLERVKAQYARLSGRIGGVERQNGRRGPLRRLTYWECPDPWRNSTSMMFRRLLLSTVVCLIAVSCRLDPLGVPFGGGAVTMVSVFPDPPSGQLHVGESADVEAIAYDSYGTFTVGRTVSFATSDSTIVRLGQGADARHRKAFAIANGKAVITVVMDGIYGSTTLTVIP